MRFYVSNKFLSEKFNITMLKSISQYIGLPQQCTNKDPFLCFECVRPQSKLIYLICAGVLSHLQVVYVMKTNGELLIYFTFGCTLVHFKWYCQFWECFEDTRWVAYGISHWLELHCIAMQCNGMHSSCNLMIRNTCINHGEIKFDDTLHTHIH